MPGIAWRPRLLPDRVWRSRARAAGEPADPDQGSPGSACTLRRLDLGEDDLPELRNHHPGQRVQRARDARVLREDRERSTCPRDPLGASVQLLRDRSEEHTSELQSLMRISYAVFCLKQKTSNTSHQNNARHLL